jgi:hypothetical protein
MGNSPLVSYTKLSPNHSGRRTAPIDTITIHCVVGHCTLETLGAIFSSPSRQVSSNYGVDDEGNVGMYVEEGNRSWCTSSRANDQRAVTIEVASDTTAPYKVTDKALAGLIDLCADICERHCVAQLLWKGDKSLVGQAEKQNMTVHRWFTAKACPGEYLYGKLGYIADEVNKRLGSPIYYAAASWRFLVGKGLNAYAAAGLMGNLYAESGLKPNNLQNSYAKTLGYTDDTYTAAVDSGAYENFVRDSAGYGLAQWTYWSRKQALLDYAKAAKTSIGDLTMQLEFLWKELQDSVVMSILAAAASIKQASDAVLTGFERPADQSEAVKAKRAGYGQEFYDKFARQAATPTPTALAVGDIVQFAGGPVYASSNAASSIVTKPASRVKITQTYNGKHPYHAVSEDGLGVYGWVDSSSAQKL